jgi:hypothetical protein
MKAWIVTDEGSGEGFSTVVFAVSANDARSKAAGTDEMNCSQYMEVSARRAPEFDGRESDPPTTRELVEKHGWYQTCDGCGCMVCEDSARRWSEDGTRLCSCDGCELDEEVEDGEE